MILLIPKSFFQAKRTGQEEHPLVLIFSTKNVRLFLDLEKARATSGSATPSTKTGPYMTA
jgi:hypothetical protein